MSTRPSSTSTDQTTTHCAPGDWPRSKVVTFPGEGSSGEEVKELFGNWSERNGRNAIVAVGRGVSDSLSSAKQLLDDCDEDPGVGLQAGTFVLWTASEDQDEADEASNPLVASPSPGRDLDDRCVWLEQTATRPSAGLADDV